MPPAPHLVVQPFLGAESLSGDSGVLALFLVCVIAAIAPIASLLLPGRPPQVVLLLLGGILIGPSVLGLADPEPISLLSDVGLGFLFLLAGYEIEPTVLRGREGGRALAAWVASLALAVVTVTLLDLAGFVKAPVPIAIALTTTALGTLLPMLRDRGVLGTPLGGQVVVTGAYGELLPVLAIAVVLGAYSSWIELLAIVGVSAFAWSLTALGRRARDTPVERMFFATAHGTAQATLRWTMVMLLGLLLLTSRFGIDSVLGAFLAGFVLRTWASADVEKNFERKLESVGYGLFIPIFFVVSGMSLDVGAVVGEPVRLVVFLGLLLLVRGLPHLVFFRGVLGAADRVRLGLLSATTLPLLVALSQIGVREGHMLPQNADALVGAGIVSVALFPFLALTVLAPRPHEEGEGDEEGSDSARSTE